jgi:hypothetical protein
MSKRAPQLRWRRQPNETGLARVCQTERGYDLRMGEEVLAQVRPTYAGFGRQSEGYYWFARSGDWLPLKNTASTPVATMEEAKREAEAYVRRYLPAKQVLDALLSA